VVIDAIFKEGRDRRKPGLRRMNRAVGTMSFGEVTSRIIIYNYVDIKFLKLSNETPLNKNVLCI